MTYFQKRRRELLGSRKRKPKAGRSSGRGGNQPVMGRGVLYAVRRLEQAWSAR